MLRRPTLLSKMTAACEVTTADCQFWMKTGHCVRDSVNPSFPEFDERKSKSMALLQDGQAASQIKPIGSALLRTNSRVQLPEGAVLARMRLMILEACSALFETCVCEIVRKTALWHQVTGLKFRSLLASMSSRIDSTLFTASSRPLLDHAAMVAE
jgi:hypothetical protein